MTSQRPDLLTPEERELADRLARIAPRGTPSAALDARILGAAHAVAGRKASPTHPRSRWPALVGIAATVALAVGVVWQLRPVHEVPTARDEVPSSAVMRPQATTAMSEEAVPDRESDTRSVAESQSRAADVAARPQPAEPRARVLSRPSPLPSPPPPVVFDDPSPVDAPKSVRVPAPPAPPAPPPPPLLAPTSAPTTNSPAAAAATRSRRYQAAPMAARMQRKAAETAAIESAVSDAPAGPGIDADQRTITIADVPVESDRTLAPVDWIERIRQRRDSGDMDGARASLGALRQAHPTLELPEDVMAIVITPATLPER